MSPSRAVRRPLGTVLIVGALLVLSIGGVAFAQFRSTHSRLQASTRVVEVGVDQGYWFVRIEVVNTGMLPWSCVWVSNPGLMAKSAPPLELGSTLPWGKIPQRFEFVLEALDEGVVPQAAGFVTFDLAVLSEQSWFLSERKLGAWPHVLPL